MMKISINFNNHPCTNHTTNDFYHQDEDCEECGSCRCEEGGYCCGETRWSAFCPDCGYDIERPMCYACNGERCGSCESSGERFDADKDVFYTGTIEAEWEYGTLVQYYSYSGHPHIKGASYCLGNAAPLFDGVDTKEKAVEAIVTHISNINFNDSVGAPFDGIGA